MAGTQIFVRNREGRVYGPIEPSTVELLIESGALQGMLQVSTDGEHYALPFRFPELRDFFPRHLWGDDGRREVELDTEVTTATGADPGTLEATLFGAADASGPGTLTPPAQPGLVSAAPAPTLTTVPPSGAGPPPGAPPPPPRVRSRSRRGSRGLPTLSRSPPGLVRRSPTTSLLP